MHTARKLELIKLIAKDRGGQCIAKKYSNSNTKMWFKCHVGHEFQSTPNSIKQGKWCRICAGNEVGSIQKMQKLAATRGGKCISRRYVNAHTHLIWECVKGHRWRAKPNNIKSGHWCNQCVLITKSINARKQWDDSSKRIVIEQGIREASKQPGLRLKRRLAALKRWKDAEFRARVIKAQSGPNNSNWIADRSLIVHRQGKGFLKSQIKRLLMKNCEWCGSKSNLQLDHIIPICANGDSRDSNAQTLCVKCNNIKRVEIDRQLQKKHRESCKKEDRNQLPLWAIARLRGIEDKGKVVMGVGTNSIRLQLPCGCCGRIIEKQPNQVRRAQKNIYCSHKCRMQGLNSLP